MTHVSCLAQDRTYYTLNMATLTKSPRPPALNTLVTYQPLGILD